MDIFHLKNSVSVHQAVNSNYNGEIDVDQQHRNLQMRDRIFVFQRDDLNEDLRRQRGKLAKSFKQIFKIFSNSHPANRKDGTLNWTLYCFQSIFCSSLGCTAPCSPPTPCSASRPHPHCQKMGPCQSANYVFRIKAYFTVTLIAKVLKPSKFKQ